MLHQYKIKNYFSHALTYQFSY